MRTLALVLVALSLPLVFVASMAAREPLRLARRFRASPERRALGETHRSLVVHACLAAACACAVPIGTAYGARAVLLFLAGAALARSGGDRMGRARPRSSRLLSPLLAPVDGLMLLVEWALTGLLRPPAAEPGPPAPGSPAEAREQVVELTRKTVENVMVPRSHVAWLRASAATPEILETVRRDPHSHYPVFEGDFEQLVGMLGLVDLASPHGEGSRAAELARPAVLVPETIACDDLLARMQRDRFDAAIVVDEFGGMAGLVTLEDLLEVLVGELVGEHEAVRVRVQKMDDGSMLVDASLRIDEAEHLTGIPFPEGDYETLAGLFLQRAAHIPATGERIELDEARLEVVAADERRIRVLRIVPGGAPARA